MRYVRHAEGAVSICRGMDLSEHAAVVGTVLAMHQARKSQQTGTTASMKSIMLTLWYASVPKIETNKVPEETYRYHMMNHAL